MQSKSIVTKNRLVVVCELGRGGGRAEKARGGN